MLSLGIHPPPATYYWAMTSSEILKQVRGKIAQEICPTASDYSSRLSMCKNGVGVYLVQL